MGLTPGTAALHMALVWWGVGPGDVVLVPISTSVATLNAARYVGAEPIFVACDEESGNIPFRLLGQAINQPKSKGYSVPLIVSMDMLEKCVECSAIEKVAEETNVRLPCKATVGAILQGRSAGSFGNASVIPIREAMSRRAALTYLRATIDVPQLKQPCDILCLPSWREGYPNVVLEAFATVLAVHTMTTNRVRDSAHHGMTTLLTEPPNSQTLEDALALLVMTHKARRRMGKQGECGLWINSSTRSYVATRTNLSRPDPRLGCRLGDVIQRQVDAQGVPHG